MNKSTVLFNHVPTSLSPGILAYRGDIKLTNRELECLLYILKGETAKSIGKILNISYRTVEIHIDRLRSKFNSRNKAELVVKAMESGYMKIISS